MPAHSNWPGGIDRSHSNFTQRFSRVSRYDGQGGWQKNSKDIPFGPAIGYTILLAVFAWALLKLPLLIWG